MNVDPETMWFQKCTKSLSVCRCVSGIETFIHALPAAAASDHLKHHSPLSLLSHLHQPLGHLPGPTALEVQPVLPGQ